MVVACHRQDQTHQLEDTWPVGYSCIYMYQLATQLDSQKQDSCFHPFYAYLFAARNNRHQYQYCLFDCFFLPGLGRGLPGSPH
jgi:hypothetical protein